MDLGSVLADMFTPKEGWSAELLTRIVLSTLLLFGYVVVLARTFGSRTFAQFTSYDFLTNVAAGSLVASAILNESLIEGSLSLLVLVLVQAAVSAWSARSEPVQELFDNRPVVLVEQGQMRREVMESARVSPAILHQHMRSAGVERIEDIRFAVLESGGKISVIGKDAS